MCFQRLDACICCYYYLKKKSNINSTMDCQILQDDLNSRFQWETDWQIKFNVDKNHSMRMTRHLLNKQIIVYCLLHKQSLEQVQSTKYLGITITDNLDWDKIFRKFQVRQLGQWVFFSTIWHCHLGKLNKLHTKHWLALSSSMQHLFVIPITNSRFNR